MDLKEFDYVLPESLIAAVPSRRLEGSRLLVLQRSSGEITHTGFSELSEFLSAGDLLVLNDTKVFPARLIGQKESGGHVEVLLLERFPEPDRTLWLGLIDAGKKPRIAFCRRDHR
jgi:S-adenosylmethionine:tRNA ribosyltransferase-isomerase